VSSERENRESVGKLNDPEKNGKLLGIPPKRRKIREFSFNYIFFEKEKLLSPFSYFFFPRKKQNPFFLKKKLNNLQNISPGLYFLGGRLQI